MWIPELPSAPTPPGFHAALETRGPGGVLLSLCFLFLASAIPTEVSPLPLIALQKFLEGPSCSSGVAQCLPCVWLAMRAGG